MDTRKDSPKSIKLSRAALTGVSGGTTRNAGQFTTKAGIEQYLHDNGYLSEGQNMNTVVQGWDQISDADVQGRNLILGTDTPTTPGEPRPIESLQGTNGNDLIISFGTFNTINGQDGDDIIFGTSGRDAIFGGDGNDRLFGGDGNDLLAGGNGNDVLHGGKDGDILIGSGQGDVLNGDAGDDLLVPGSGDVVTDTEGNNQYGLPRPRF